MSQLKQLNKSRMSPEALCWLKLFTKNNITVTQIHPLSLICEKGFLFFPPTMSSFYNFSINVSKILTSRVPQDSFCFICLSFYSIAFQSKGNFTQICIIKNTFPIHVLFLHLSRHFHQQFLHSYCNQ